ncbi:MAG: cbb3-type cytochrome oxidase assembly protein CcoS [Phenylobacterium sp.]|uniref:cbb3-type cytochrome oxidase assembly protein CcoS n=1 Tax=Phenylobacterium sp. TaxID=1871053 RepID=UPI00391B1E1E
MNIMLVLAPLSVLIALGGLAAFWWSLKSGQYDDPAGDAARILAGDPDDRPL